jgi:uncharacterized protein YcnI
MRRNRLIPAVCATAVAALVLLAIGIGPVAAHVVPDPGEAPKGGSAEIAFRVPNERDDASTVKVVIAFPTDHPIPSVSVEAKPGWTTATETTKLAKPLQTDDGPVSEAVSRVTWSGGKIGPGQHGDFTVALESIPSDTNELVFKALQTYSDGQVIRWIEPTGPGGKEPDRPAPTLKLVAASEAAGHSPGATTVAPTTNAATTKPASTGGDVATKKDVDSAKTAAIIGIVVGAAALIAAVVAIGTGRRRSPA